jgi:hypothetical protein
VGAFSWKQPFWRARLPQLFRLGVSSKKIITFVLSWNQVSYKCIYYLPISVDVRKFPETVMYS